MGCYTNLYKVTHNAKNEKDLHHIHSYKGIHSFDELSKLELDNQQYQWYVDYGKVFKSKEDVQKLIDMLWEERDFYSGRLSGMLEYLRDNLEFDKYYLVVTFEW